MPCHAHGKQACISLSRLKDVCTNPHLYILVGFLQLRRQYQISHEVQRGAQRASRAVLGTSGLHACGEGECVIALDVYPHPVEGAVWGAWWGRRPSGLGDDIPMTSYLSPLEWELLRTEPAHSQCPAQGLAQSRCQQTRGSGWGTFVHLWRIHVEVWQNQYNIVK